MGVVSRNNLGSISRGTPGHDPVGYWFREDAIEATFSSLEIFEVWLQGSVIGEWELGLKFLNRMDLFCPEFLSILGRRISFNQILESFDLRL